MSKATLSRRQLFKKLLLVGGPVAAAIFLVGLKRPNRVFEQVLGPFFPDPDDPIEPIRELGNKGKSFPMSNDWDLTQVKGKQKRAEGQIVSLTGKVLNPNGEAVPNASLMLWQASSSGRYNHQDDSFANTFEDPRGKTIERKLDPNFQYWGHTITDATGSYRVRTIIPGYYPADLDIGWFRPPHIHFIAKAEGLPELVTQTYFKGDAIPDNRFIQTLNARDFVLRNLKLKREEQERLIIEYKPAADDPGVLTGHFDFQLRTA
ncbi:MAG: hypothetical protein G3M70_06145 [Candidatus Nitronauta litoralis]|uniref:Intradiol ring-cleavage dioxygenases domain-containing protein n=1 Tax=Candidatus Nitronauta litoralis TaxID=2705533 RepID=A0A7T0FZF3_9BACT|nr:MAG: hypothetical protein G3M70_06145 [Candidatus Nitronauta litoralis]